MHYRNLSQGAVAGLIATVPMTLSMIGIRRLANGEGDRLQMEQVMRRTAKKLDVYHKMDESERETFTWLGHLGIGASAGAIYTALISIPEESSLGKGIGFGLAVWASSYAGVLPKLDLMRRPSEERTHTLVEEIASHVVWGAALGLLSGYLAKRNPVPRFAVGSPDLLLSR